MTEKEQINRIVGSNIKRERAKAGFTQERFSEMLGIGPKSLSAIERGTVGISLTLLCRICKVLSITSDSLLFVPKSRNEVQAMTEKLELLTPEQMSIANDVLGKLLEAFALKTDENRMDTLQ